MKVAYTNDGSDKEKSAELYAIGNSLLLEIDGKQHRIILTVEQWNLLADVARDRVKDDARATERRKSGH